MSDMKYKRVLLKVSGEALGEKTAAGDGFGLDFAKVNEVCAAIKSKVLGWAPGMDSLENTISARIWGSSMGSSVPA